MPERKQIGFHGSEEYRFRLQGEARARRMTVQRMLEEALKAYLEGPPRTPVLELESAAERRFLERMREFFRRARPEEVKFVERATMLTRRADAERPPNAYSGGTG